MKILVQREKTIAGQTCTHGKMFLINDGHDPIFFCYTLEDIVRTGAKVYGMTAIAAGTYKVKVSMSNRFKKLLPEILNVPDFSGVRIHGGNHDTDTLGCVLVGGWRHDDSIGNCAPYVKNLTELIQKAKDCTIEIKNA